MKNEDLTEEFAALQSGHTMLQLNYKGLHQIPQCLLEDKIYNHLDRLYLKRNLLKEVPSSINNLTNLVELYLHSNEITMLPQDLGGLVNLEYLDVSSNHLTDLPESVGQLSKLKKLHLSNNAVGKLPKEIGMLKNLVSLEAVNNGMSYLPLQLFDCHQLVTLNLDNNKLTSLPRQLYRLANLSELSVCGNNLIVIPQTVGGMDNLAALYLDSNPGLYALPFNTKFKEIGFNRCGTHAPPDSLLENFCSVTVRHTETCTVTIPLSQEITMLGSNVNCVPSLMELCLRSMHKILRIGNNSDASHFVLGNVPLNLACLLLYPTAVCQYCQREVFVMAFPIIFQGRILLNNVYFLGLCCSLKCVRQCFSEINYPLVFPRLEDLSLAIVQI